MSIQNLIALYTEKNKKYIRNITTFKKKQIQKELDSLYCKKVKVFYNSLPNNKISWYFKTSNNITNDAILDKNLSIILDKYATDTKDSLIAIFKLNHSLAQDFLDIDNLKKHIEAYKTIESNFDKAQDVLFTAKK